MARDADQTTVQQVFGKGRLRIPDSQRKFEWEERRYSDGFRVFYSDLVTQVNKFA